MAQRRYTLRLDDEIWGRLEHWLEVERQKSPMLNGISMHDYVRGILIKHIADKEHQPGEKRRRGVPKG